MTASTRRTLRRGIMVLRCLRPHRTRALLSSELATAVDCVTKLKSLSARAQSQKRSPKY